jgi:hypothetical protein
MNRFKIEKVPLRTILEGLTDLYNAGFEYFDLTATITDDDKRDMINVSVIPSYRIPEKEDEDFDYEDLI